LSETQPEPTEDEKTVTEYENRLAMEEPPEGVDPDTGEVTGPVEPDADDAEAEAENQRRAELAAERQAAEQAVAETEAAIEKQGKALDRAAKAYTDKLLAALGDDLSGWHACPLCADGYPGIRMQMMPSPEQLARVKVEIGEDPDPDLPADAYSRQCSSCEGYGRVKTGSRVTAQKSAQCHDCKGRGWIPVGSERESGNITASNGSTDLAPVVLQDNASNDPPEVEMLKQLGYIVVPPVPQAEPSTFGGA